MRILIIGAGVLGSNLAHSLRKGNDITILARGNTYENLKEKSEVETKVYDKLKLELLNNNDN